MCPQKQICTDAEADMYIQLSTIWPNVKHLSASMQTHPSH